MKCQYCDNEIPDNASACPSCGAARQTPAQPAPQPQFQAQAQAQAMGVAPKSRVAFILLALFLGGFGIHNFYAGYTTKGIIQLLISVLSCGYGAIVVWVWVIIEACTVTVDANNIPMQ